MITLAIRPWSNIGGIYPPSPGIYAYDTSWLAQIIKSIYLNIAASN